MLSDSGVVHIADEYLGKQEGAKNFAGTFDGMSGNASALLGSMPSSVRAR